MTAALSGDELHAKITAHARKLVHAYANDDLVALTRYVWLCRAYYRGDRSLETVINFHTLHWLATAIADERRACVLRWREETEGALGDLREIFERDRVVEPARARFRLVIGNVRVRFVLSAKLIFELSAYF
jgi:hypothetical protein